MRLVYDFDYEYDYIKGKDVLTGGTLDIVCEHPEEFLYYFNLIRHLEFVVWSGCPVEEAKEFRDLVTSVRRRPNMTVQDVKDELKLRREIIMSIFAQRPTYKQLKREARISRHLP